MENTSFFVAIRSNRRLAPAPFRYMLTDQRHFDVSVQILLPALSAGNHFFRRTKLDTRPGPAL